MAHIEAFIDFGDEENMGEEIFQAGDVSMLLRVILKLSCFKMIKHRFFRNNKWSKSI